MVVTDKTFPIDKAISILQWIEGSPTNINEKIKFKVETIEGSSYLCKISYDSNYIGTLLLTVFNAGDKNGFDRCKRNII